MNETGAIFLIVLLLIGTFAWRMISRARSGEDTTPNRIGDGLRDLENQKTQYRHLTQEKLAQVPTEDVLKAVLANLWGKMAPGLDNAQEVLVSLSPERQGLYAIYAVYGGVQQGGFAGLLGGTDAAFIPNAAAMLDALQAYGSADILRRAISGEGDASLLDDVFLETFDAEDVRGRLAQYVAHAPDQFCDVDSGAEVGETEETE